MGKTLVAPVVTYVPEGSWENIGGHMAKPGTITLPEDRFVELLVSAGRSLKAGGFKKIWFLGESGGNRTGMRIGGGEAERAVERRRDRLLGRRLLHQGARRAEHLGREVPEGRRRPGRQPRQHPRHLRADVRRAEAHSPDRLTGNDYPNNGVSGNNQSKSTPEVGKALLQIKMDLALAQIKRMNDGSEPPVAKPQAPQGGGGGGRGGQNAGGPRPSLEPTMNTAPASMTPTKAPDTVFIDELTWEENRDAMKAGKTVFIVPIGGTEKNGYHMVMGKHNFIVAHSANLMARRLKNALVAPTIQYVPEGDPDRQNPGAISLPSPAYDMLLDAAARSLKAHGATEILFIGDSGGNQQGMRDVAAKLNEEWKGGTHEGLRADRLLRRRPRALSRVDGSGVRLHRRHHRQPRRHQRHVADAAREADRRAQGSDQAVGRSEGLGRVRRSDEGDRGDRPHGHRVQDQRGAQSVPAAEESAAAARWPRRTVVT